MILRHIILIAIVLCVSSCKHTQAEREKEINTLFKAIHKHEAEHEFFHKTPVSDRFGIFPDTFFWTGMSADFLDEDNDDHDFLSKEDIKYIYKQYDIINRNKLRHWSKTNIIIGKSIVNLDIAILSNLELLEDKWWNGYTKQYGYKEIQWYSYPILNKAHNKAYFIFSYFSLQQHKTISPHIYTYIKNEKGEWEYSSREPLY